MGATAGLFLLQGAETYTKVSQLNRQASAVKAQGAYEGTAYDRNATLAEAQGEDAVQRGTMAAAIRRAQVRGEIGSARANFGAQGVDVGVGSAVDVQSDYARLGALDIATIRNNAAREAWGYAAQASDFRTRGAMARAGADAEALGLQSDVATTLLTGVAKTYGIYRSRDGRSVSQSSRSNSSGRIPANVATSRPAVRDIKLGKAPGVATLPIPQAKRPPGTY